MDLYTRTSYELSRKLTLRYSTSFGKSSGLFDASIRHHIFAIYGLVRIGDEIVDTYKGSDQAALLDELEDATYRAMKTGYSTNPIIHAFADTARIYGITKTLIHPFFESMRMDLAPKDYTEKLYKTYIHGSAEVVGLMCLKVFVEGDSERYEQLRPGAEALGSAYQKVNFLRDIAGDHEELGRIYFPGCTFETFDEADKRAIETDIANDFKVAHGAVLELPLKARKAVLLSFAYYSELLRKIEQTPVDVLKKKRVRVPDAKKLAISLAPKRYASWQK